jgi:AAA+ ATPase superfamily predicted ATPase
MTPFLDRHDELTRLERYWSSDRAEFVVLTGRRRVGKSRLLEESSGTNPISTSSAPRRPFACN